MDPRHKLATVSFSAALQQLIFPKNNHLNIILQKMGKQFLKKQSGAGRFKTYVCISDNIHTNTYIIWQSNMGQQYWTVKKKKKTFNQIFVFVSLKLLTILKSPFKPR